MFNNKKIKKMELLKGILVMAILSPIFVQAQDVEKISVDNVTFNMIKVAGDSVRMGGKNSNAQFWIHII